MSTAGFHITEDCAEVYLQNESGMEFLQLARRLHDYLQQGQRLPARSLFEATDDCKEISREAFDALAKHRMENTMASKPFSMPVTPHSSLQKLSKRQRLSCLFEAGITARMSPGSRAASDFSRISVCSINRTGSRRPSNGRPCLKR